MNDEERVLSSFNEGSQLRKLLIATKGESSFQTGQLPGMIQNSSFLHSLESAQLLQKEKNQWMFSGYSKVRVAIRALQLGEPNRPVLTALTWQEFEQFVARVLIFHEFHVRHRFRFSRRRRYEIDIVAGRRPVLFSIDCKQYGVRLGKTTSLRNAAKAQLGRTEVLAANFAQFQVDLGCVDWTQPVLIPMVVTMLTEDVQFHEQIPIVPAALLNAFLLNYEKQIDRLYVIRPSFGHQARLI